MNSKELKEYLIPATEGFFFNNYDEENINELSNKKTLVIFTTDSNLPYGGVDIVKYTSKYHYNLAVEIKLDDMISRDPKKKLPMELRDELSKFNSLEFKDLEESFKKILKITDDYVKSHNELIVLTVTNSQHYGAQIFRKYPIIIMHGSMVKSFVRNFNRDLSNNIKSVIGKDAEYERMLTKIPKELFVKNRNFELFHVSPNKDIKELTPRISMKRLYNENIRIPRVSAAPSIDACFRAVGLTLNKNDRPIKYYVYQLMIDKNTRIVKPSVELVPDQKYTNEYWILDPIKVKCLGYITVSLDKKTKNLKFDDSTITRDAMVTTTFYKD